MKVYVSAHSIIQAKLLAAALEAAGHTIVSQWHKEKPIAGYSTTGLPDSEKPDRAITNFHNIASADVYVGIVADTLVPGGKFVEQGFALGLGKRCYLFGDKRENLSSFHPGFTLVDSVSAIG